MKRTRVFALALVVSIMLMGAGYAAWTDTLTVGSTVETGEMNVKFTDSILKSLENESSQRYIITSIPQKNEKDITLEIQNMYPGAGVYFETSFKNFGTIPALIKDIAFEDIPDGTAPTFNGKALRFIDAAQKAHFFVTGTVTYYGNNYKKDYPINTTLEKLPGVLNSIKPRLEPGDFIKIGLNMTVDNNVTNELSLENRYAKFKITVNFIQHNQ